MTDRDTSERDLIAAVDPWMQKFAKTPDRQHALPDPAVVWLKAQLLRNTMAAERVSRPMNAIQIAAYVVVGIAWAALLTWKWEAMQTWFLSLNPSQWLSGTVATSGATSLSFGFFITVLMLASATVVLALHTVLAED
jgi:hypothetical protein